MLLLFCLLLEEIVKNYKVWRKNARKCENVVARPVLDTPIDFARPRRRYEPKKSPTSERLGIKIILP